MKYIFCNISYYLPAGVKYMSTSRMYRYVMNVFCCCYIFQSLPVFILCYFYFSHTKQTNLRNLCTGQLMNFKITDRNRISAWSVSKRRKQTSIIWAWLKLNKKISSPLTPDRNSSSWDKAILRDALITEPTPVHILAALPSREMSEPMQWKKVKRISLFKSSVHYEATTSFY